VWLKHFPLSWLTFSVFSAYSWNCSWVNIAEKTTHFCLPLWSFTLCDPSPSHCRIALMFLKCDLQNGSMDSSPQRFCGRRWRTCPRINLWDDGAELLLSLHSCSKQGSVLCSYVVIALHVCDTPYSPWHLEKERKEPQRLLSPSLQASHGTVVLLFPTHI